MRLDSKFAWPFKICYRLYMRSCGYRCRIARSSAEIEAARALATKLSIESGLIPPDAPPATATGKAHYGDAVLAYFCLYYRGELVGTSFLRDTRRASATADSYVNDSERFTELLSRPQRTLEMGGLALAPAHRSASLFALIQLFHEMAEFTLANGARYWLMSTMYPIRFAIERVTPVIILSDSYAFTDDPDRLSVVGRFAVEQMEMANAFYIDLWSVDGFALFKRYALRPMLRKLGMRRRRNVDSLAASRATHKEN